MTWEEEEKAAAEARRKEKQEALDGLKQSWGELKASWKELPSWPYLVPAFLMLGGLIAMVVWVLCQ